VLDQNKIYIKKPLFKEFFSYLSIKKEEISRSKSHEISSDFILP